MPENRANVPIIAGLGDISSRYDALLCDVWGVVHNGREVFPAASDALCAFRKQGGVVVLITNAPRPSAPILEQVLQLGLAPAAFDTIVTSGDVTISLIADRIGAAVHHIGPERDLTLFDAAAERAGAKARLVGLEAADYVLCTGLFEDDVETPEHYDATLRRIAERNIPFICANPDLVVHRGDKLIYCAGALAEPLKALGGQVIYCGKPHAPIYRTALSAAERALGRKLDTRRVLAVGDGMRTDIAGAYGQGLDALFVSGGIHLADVHGAEGQEAAALQALFERERVWPSAAIRALRP
jgi:HAD superfamily hydrolase (TIGR01459 family)